MSILMGRCNLYHKSDYILQNCHGIKTMTIKYHIPRGMNFEKSFWRLYTIAYVSLMKQPSYKVFAAGVPQVATSINICTRILSYCFVFNDWSPLQNNWKIRSCSKNLGVCLKLIFGKSPSYRVIKVILRQEILCAWYWTTIHEAEKRSTNALRPY